MRVRLRRRDAAAQIRVWGVKTRPSGCQLYCRKIEFEGEFLIVITKILLLQLYNLKTMFDAGELKLEEFTQWTCWPCNCTGGPQAETFHNSREMEKKRGDFLRSASVFFAFTYFYFCNFKIVCYKTEAAFFLWANCNLDIYIIFELLIGLEAKRIVTLLLVSLDQVKPAGMRWIVYKRTQKSSF